MKAFKAFLAALAAASLVSMTDHRDRRSRTKYSKIDDGQRRRLRKAPTTAIVHLETDHS
jgi:hypothetical protein